MWAAGCWRNFTHFAGHDPLPANASIARGVAPFTVFREPLSRTVSGYFHHLHDCYPMQQRYGLHPNHGGHRAAAFYQSVNRSVVEEYARCVGGCAARMLTGLRCGPTERTERGRGSRPPGAFTQEDDLRRVPEAVRAVRERLAFVGLTSRWADTIRAFAAFARTRAKKTDLAPKRQRRYDPRAKAQVEGVLRGFAFADRPVYDAAVERFGQFQAQCSMGLKGLEREGTRGGPAAGPLVSGSLGNQQSLAHWHRLW